MRSGARFGRPSRVRTCAARRGAGLCPGPYRKTVVLWTPDGKGDERGFTLLEVLVALVVLGFVLAGIAGGVQFGQRAADMQARSIAAHADLGSADRLLRRLVAAMDAGSLADPPHLTAGSSALGFTTDLGSAAAALGTGEADVGLVVDAGHRLVLRWQPSLHAIRLLPPPLPQTAILLDGVERVEFAYWGHPKGGGDGGGGQWLTRWTERDIPALVRIRLRFMPEAHRSWPDIIAATELLRRNS